MIIRWKKGKKNNDYKMEENMEKGRTTLGIRILSY